MSFFKKVLPKSISSRFFLILITPVVLSQLIFGVLFFGKYTASVIGTITGQIAGDVVSISKMLDLKIDKQIIDDIKKIMNLNVEVIENSKLEKFGIEKNNKIYRSLGRALNRKSFKNYYIKPFENKIHVYLNSSDKKDVYKISFLRKSIYTKIIPIVLGWGLASSIVLLIIAFIFLKNQIRPIKNLANAAEKFGHGVETNDFIPEGALEVRMAGMAFCEMKKNFRNLMNDRMKTLAGISHDLRTPLTKMKLQLSIMPRTKETEWLMQDVNMMIKITESFTLHASAQNKEIFAYRNLNSFLNDVSKDYFSDKFKIHIHGDNSIEILIKYISLKRAIGNIISNASKYASNLYINFEKNADYIAIYFEDDGKGIPEEYLDIIFSPFVSQNSARTQNNDVNVGLGLSIARDVITDHGGEISAGNSKKYGGACFTLTFPINL